MKIAIASLGDPRSVATWSGIPASIIAALVRRGHEVLPIHLTTPTEPWHYPWLRRFYHRIHKKWFLGSVERQWLQNIAEQLDAEVNNVSPDVVLVIHADWLAYSTFKYPACIIHDTTFASIVNYYPSFTNLSNRSLKQGNQMYQRALDKSAAAIFSATWATQSAISAYRYPASRAFTIPFGANIDKPPGEADVSSWISDRSKYKSCNFVFIGTQWKRKGGPEALQFISALERLGVPATLAIVGCSPEIPSTQKRFVKEIGYLRKDVPSDIAKFNHIMKTSHALIVLSHAECYGCVYCEANAYGLPALGRETGGVPEIIKEPINGLLLKPSESIENFAERWAGIWNDRAAYSRLAKNSRGEFQQRLNFEVFGEKLEGVLDTLVPK